MTIILEHQTVRELVWLTIGLAALAALLYIFHQKNR